MRDFVILFIHLTVTVVRLGLPGGLRFRRCRVRARQTSNGARQKRDRSDNRNLASD
jgi:hypothetical protein